jgi:hypothetical protein
LKRARVEFGAADDGVRRGFNHRSYAVRNLVGCDVETSNHGEVLPLDKAAEAEFIDERCHASRCSGGRHQKAEAISAASLLRTRCKRPRGCRAANQCDEVAPLHYQPQAQQVAS